MYAIIINAGDIELITPIDMAIAAEKALESGRESQIHYLVAEVPGGQAVHYLFLPNAGRGAVCDGGGSQWTDADSVDDLESRRADRSRWSN